jgi:hypothetical protein
MAALSPSSATHDRPRRRDCLVHRGPRSRTSSRAPSRVSIAAAFSSEELDDAPPTLPSPSSATPIDFRVRATTGRLHESADDQPPAGTGSTSVTCRPPTVAAFRAVRSGSRSRRWAIEGLHVLSRSDRPARASGRSRRPMISTRGWFSFQTRRGRVELRQGSMLRTRTLAATARSSPVRRRPPEGDFAGPSVPPGRG